MDPKTLQVISKISSNPDGITEIYRDGSEYYFKYRDYSFSLIDGPERESKWGPYSFYIYPKDGRTKLTSLAEDSKTGSLSDDRMIGYHTGKETTSVINEFSKLAQALKRKDLNLDKIMDDILNG